jgi:hypothetical protein
LLGSSSLAIQFWELYTIVNEKNGTIMELCDGQELKCSFRRTVDDRMCRVWMEVVQLASTIVFCEEEDALVWKFSSKGIYTSQSLYKVINIRGVIPIHTPNIWSLNIPARIHFFHWLLFKNKVLTRDNLAKRQHVEDKRCLFCDELESSQHIFFDCVVAKKMWGIISDIVGRDMGTSFQNIDVCWLSNRKFSAVNIISSAALWGVWKLRNEICFQNKSWRNIKILMMKVAGLAQNWAILCPANKKQDLNTYISKILLWARSQDVILL